MSTHKAIDLFQAVSQAAATLASSATGAAKGRMEATYLNIGAVYGTLVSLAMTVGQNPDDEGANADDFEPTRRINPDTLLFSALLVVECVQPQCHESKNIGNGMAASINAVTFSPESVFNALLAFEKLTGRKPDSMLNRGMIQPARELGESGTVTLSDFMKKRPTAPGTPTPQ